MNEPRWDEVLRIVEAVLELPEAERADRIAGACGGDADLLAAVNRVLADATGAADRLEPLEAFRAPAGADAREDEVPQRLGAFVLLDRLGSGTGGTVYRARDTGLDRVVALKLLPFGATRGELDRFRREARAVARLEHPAIVRVLAVDRFADRDFFVMELVDGHDLAREVDLQLCARDTGDAGRCLLPPFRSDAYVPAVCTLVAEIAGALDHAHASGIVHRDVKAGNLLIERTTRRIKIVDFGIALDARWDRLTEPGVTPCTPAYMSPEQVQGNAAAVDHRTDVYSLGVVLYELLALRLPFVEATPDRLKRSILAGAPLALAKLNERVAPDLATICAKAMATRPSERFQRAAELSEALHRFLGGNATGVRAPRSRRVLLARRTALGVGLATLGAVAWKLVDGWLHPPLRWVLLVDDQGAPMRLSWDDAVAAARARGLRLPTVDEGELLVRDTRVGRVGELATFEFPGTTVMLPIDAHFWTSSRAHSPDGDKVEMIQWPNGGVGRVVNNWMLLSIEGTRKQFSMLIARDPPP